MGSVSSVPLWPKPAGTARINLLAPTGHAGSFSRPSHARVVELVDTQVSEACALTACEFESRLGHSFGGEPKPGFCHRGTELAEPKPRCFLTADLTDLRDFRR